MNETKLLKYFIDYRKINCDNYSSFTYGRFLYDMLNEGRVDENTFLYEALEEKTQLMIDKEYRTRITWRVIAELLDLDELQNYAEAFIFNEIQ